MNNNTFVPQKIMHICQYELYNRHWRIKIQVYVYQMADRF